MSDPDTQPSQTGFLVFVRGQMGIPSNYLPDASPQVGYAYNWSLDIVNQDLQCSPASAGAWSPYVRAVYNLAGHTLVEWAVDQSYPLSTISSTSGLVTAATTAPSAILPGDRLQIAGVSPLGYSGPPNLGYVVVQATPTTSEFQYNLPRDPGTATLLTGAAANETYFQQLRARLKLGEFAPGVVTNASDVSTSAGLLNPDFMRSFTLEDLQLLKTPWGRAAIGILQKYGPTIWGVS